MTLVPIGTKATGTYEIRSGFCSECETAFQGDPRDDGLRYCGSCVAFRKGELKGQGTFDPQPPKEQ